MKTPKPAAYQKQKKKPEELSFLQKIHNSLQVQDVVQNIKLTFIGVILLASADILINLFLGTTEWYLLSLHASQICISCMTIASLKIWPPYHSLINAAASVAINTIWAISQVNSEEIHINSHAERGVSQSSGFAYCIGNLSLIMISNSSSLNLKIPMIALNITLFCALSDFSSRSIQYMIVAFILAFICLRYHENNRKQINSNTEQVYNLIDALPQTFMVVKQDKTKENIVLDLLNDRAKRLMKSIHISTFADLSSRLIIIRKRSKQPTRKDNPQLFSKNSINRPDNVTSKNNNNTESLFYLEEPSQKSYKKRNLHTFLLEKFSELESLVLGEEIQKQSSLQSQDKKSTKTNLAGAPGVVATEFTNKAVASRSLFVPSKSFINLKSTSQQKKVTKLSQQAAQKMQDVFANEDYECTLMRDPSLQEEDDDQELDIRIILSLGLHNYDKENQLILQFNQIPNSSQSQYQSQYDQASIAIPKAEQRAFFYEEFSKHSLMKSTQTALEVVQTLKTLISRSQMITELELNRFITYSNLTTTSNLNNLVNTNINPNSNSNIVTVDSTLSNNLRLSSNSIGAVAASSVPTVSAVGAPKAIYCIPKRQLDNILQLSLLASSTVSNYTNYFAVKEMHPSEITPKFFSLLQVIKNVQRIFQRTIDSQHITLLVSSYGDLSSDNPEVLQQIQRQPVQVNSNNNLNSSNVSLSNISIHGVQQNGNVNNNNNNLSVNSNSNQFLGHLPGSSSNIPAGSVNIRRNSASSASNSFQALQLPATSQQQSLQNPLGLQAKTTITTISTTAATQQSQQLQQQNQATQSTQLAGNQTFQLLEQTSNILDQSSQQQLFQSTQKQQQNQQIHQSQQPSATLQSGNSNNPSLSIPPAGQNPPQVGGVWFMGMKGLDEIRNDESMVQHLLFNLLQNAVENTPPYGTIAIYLSRDNDGSNANGQSIKVRIRNQCAPDYFFPFVSHQNHELDLSWRAMVQEFKESDKFYFGIRMATQLASIIGPPDSLVFKDIQEKEFQVEFRILDIPIEQEDQSMSMKDSTSKLENSNFNKQNNNNNNSNNVDIDNQSSVNNSKNYSKKHFSGKQNRQRFHSQSSYQVKMDSADSFDKWIQIQNLEQHKTSNTIGIRNQLKYKN